MLEIIKGKRKPGVGFYSSKRDLVVGTNLSDTRHSNKKSRKVVLSAKSKTALMLAKSGMVEIEYLNDIASIKQKSAYSPRMFYFRVCNLQRTTVARTLDAGSS